MTGTERHALRMLLVIAAGCLLGLLAWGPLMIWTDAPLRPLRVLWLCLAAGTVVSLAWSATREERP